VSAPPLSAPPAPPGAGGPPAQAAPPGRLLRWWRGRAGYRLLCEAALMYGLLVAYKMVRLLARGQTSEAFRNAREIMHFEEQLGFFNEARLQELVLGSETLLRFINVYYVSAHFTMTAVVLVALYVGAPDTYRRVRRVLVGMTAIALVVHVGYPLAPPRMFPLQGFVDTGLLYGPSPYGEQGIFEGVANQVAAMPSLHVGWALMVAWAVVSAARHPARWLIVVHPVLTIAAVVLTANHYWMDGIVATGILVLMIRLEPHLARIGPRRRAVGDPEGLGPDGLEPAGLLSAGASPPAVIDLTDGAERAPATAPTAGR